MRDYAELIEALRYCSINGSDAPCNKQCPYYAKRDGYECIWEMMRKTADAIEELLAKVPKWISVEERLPEHYRVVLVIKDHPVDYLHGYEFAARLQNGEWPGNSRKVLFWMPLPEPPKEDAE